MKGAKRRNGSHVSAAIYIRVSSDDQARRGYSLGEQEERCRALAYELGAREVATYTDGGESGSKLDRPGLTSLREALRAGLHDLVVVLDPDRLARNLSLQLALHDEFRHAGVALEFVNLDWEDTPDGRLFLQMRGAIAEYEREKIRMRTYAGRRRKARQGGLPCGPVDAYGYRYDREGKRLLPDPVQADRVRELFRWAAYGEPQLFPDGVPGPGRIAAVLNRLGIPAARGAAWHANTVRQILRNRRYVGELVTFRTALERGRRRPTPADEQIVVAVPALVDRSTFEQAAANLAASGRRAQGGPRYPYLLSGLLRCGLCGRALHGSLQRLRRRTHPVDAPTYVCSGRPHCRLPVQRAAQLEAQVWDAVVAFLATIELEPQAGPSHRVRFLQHLQADQAEQRRRLATAFRLGGLTETEYQAELERLHQAARAVEQELAAQPDKPAALLPLASLPLPARRALCGLVVERATITAERLTLRLRTTPHQESDPPSPPR